MGSKTIGEIQGRGIHQRQRYNCWVRNSLRFKSSEPGKGLSLHTCPPVPFPRLAVLAAVTNELGEPLVWLCAASVITEILSTLRKKDQILQKSQLLKILEKLLHAYTVIFLYKCRKLNLQLANGMTFLKLMCQVKPLQPEIKMLKRFTDPYMLFIKCPILNDMPFTS